jgi:hypothetical protein
MWPGDTFHVESQTARTPTFQFTGLQGYLAYEKVG